MTVLQLLYFLRIKGCMLLLERHHHSLSYNPVTSTFLLFFTHTYTHTMICSAPFALVFLFAQAALALPQAGSASTTPPTGTTTPPTTSPPTSYSSTGTTSLTPTPYITTGSTPQYTSFSYASSSPYASSSGCPCNATPSAWTGKNGTSYSSSSTSSSCSCSSSTPYSSTPYSSPPYSSQPTYTSSSPSYYPPKGTGKPYPPPSNPSKGPEPPTSATLRTTFDPTYDNKSGSMNNAACSNGANGLSARFPTFGDVPSFPFIGGAFDVVWNSPNCGSCWNLTNAATGTSINIVAVDAAGSGFNIAQEAFVQLNGGQIGQGVLDVFASKVAPSVCGL